MSSPGVRVQRSVVDLVAQRGYDRVGSLEKKKRLIKQRPLRICSLDSCSTKLSMYNDTDFCAKHQRGNIPLPKHL